MSYLNTDVPELQGFDTGTVLGNLELWETRLEGMLEGTLGELSELAEAILHDAAGDPDTVFSILLSLRGQPVEEEISPLKSRDLLPHNIPFLENMTRHLGLYERLVLYSFIARRVPRLPFLSTRADDVPAAAKGRVAYMPGALADQAYIRFAEHIPHCRAAVFHGFVDACEEVWGGLCEYCILPLESTTEGKLLGFSRLIIKYRLQIIAVCDVTDAGEETMRFALLRTAGEDWSAEYSPLSSEKNPVTYLEVLHAASLPNYSEITAAAEFFGLLPLRIDTLPLKDIYTLRSEYAWQTTLPTETPPPLMTTVWQVSGKDIAAFLCYLALEASEDPVLGLYPLI